MSNWSGVQFQAAGAGNRRVGPGTARGTGTELRRGQGFQLSLFDRPDPRREAVARVKRAVNERFGRFTVRSGATLLLPNVYKDPANDFDVRDVAGQGVLLKGEPMGPSFFLDRVREWWAVADVLRARGAPEWDPALKVWREAAWCHLLLTAGRYSAVVTHLTAVVRTVTGAAPPDVGQPEDETQVLRAAADLFGLLRSAVSARHPGAFALKPAA